MVRKNFTATVRLEIRTSKDGVHCDPDCEYYRLRGCDFFNTDLTNSVAGFSNPNSYLRCDACKKAEAVERSKNKMVIDLQAGLVENVYTNEPIEVLIIDHDTENQENVIEFEHEEVSMEGWDSKVNPDRIYKAFKTYHGPDFHDDVLRGYLEALLWAETDGDKHLDEDYDISDIFDLSVEKARSEIKVFIEQAEEFFTKKEWADPQQIGHDLHLTRNHHGAGFWDGDYERGEELTKIAEKLGEVTPYVGDDKKIYTT